MEIEKYNTNIVLFCVYQDFFVTLRALSVNSPRKQRRQQDLPTTDKEAKKRKYLSFNHIKKRI
jgi:hypothetical protein